MKPNTKNLETTPESDRDSTNIRIRGVLLVAYSFSFDVPHRCNIIDDVTVGRSYPSDIQVNDTWLSKTHFSVELKNETFVITDLNSTNGTFVNGERLTGSAPLEHLAVIRAGRTVFVYFEEAARLTTARLSETYGFAGRFHVPELLKRLEKLAASTGHILLTGPTGSGKELAAHALAKMMKRELVIHNTAKFGSEDEAAASLFGLAPRVFTNVDGRMGLLEQAHCKALFLDETNSLPVRTQKSLLRFVENGLASRIGDSHNIKALDVRCVLASNEPAPLFGLAHDLVARLRIVELTPLGERVADIPSIFQFVVSQSFQRLKVDVPCLRDLFTADHYESLCLDRFQDTNVRGLIAIADDIADDIRYGADPSKAVKAVFRDRYRDDAVSRRRSSRSQKSAALRGPSKTSIPSIMMLDPLEDTVDDPSVLSAAGLDQQTLNLVRIAHRECHGIIQSMVVFLRDQCSVRLSRGRLARVLDEIGLPRMKRRRS